MTSFSKIFENWILYTEGNDLPQPEPKSLRILDFDHTVAFTGELVYIMSPEGEVVETLDSEEYSHHSFSRDEVIAGYYYDFREFDDVNPEKARENHHVTEILRNFVNASPERIILILTARNQESESGIRNYLDTIGIDHSKIAVVGVGSSAPQKKVDIVKNYLDEYPTITAVSFFDDSRANTDEMKAFLSARSADSNQQLSFDVAKVDSSGKLKRMPGYRSKKEA